MLLNSADVRIRYRMNVTKTKKRICKFATQACAFVLLIFYFIYECLSPPVAGLLVVLYLMPNTSDTEAWLVASFWQNTRPASVVLIIISKKMMVSFSSLPVEGTGRH